MARGYSDNQKGGDKPKRRGNHNQCGNQNNFRDCACKQSKVVLTLDPVPEATKMTSVKILENMDNKVKEKLPNYRDDNNRALLVDLYQKVVAICKTYALYNGNGNWKIVAQAQHHAMYGECKETWQEYMNDTHNWGANEANKHKRTCQKLCQWELGGRVFLDQCAASARALSTKVTTTRRWSSAYTQSTIL